MKRLLGLLIPLFLLLPIIPQTHANEMKASASSAKLAKTQLLIEQDSRAKVLRKYLEIYKSPLADNAETFVAVADKYNLDWRFVASISGVESTFAKHLPYNSYNAWGWGIYGDNMIFFTSYDEAIETISKSLREKYMDKWGAENVHEIGRYYASSPTWSQKVTFFMNQIEIFSAHNQIDTLSISI